MAYQSTGKLIGYSSYTKNKTTYHVYSILNGEIDPKSGLYDELNFVVVRQEEQTLKELKPQIVSYEATIRTVGGKTYPSFMNVRPIENVSDTKK
jgi:hypothetical protein